VTATRLLITTNTGSSSIKAAVYELASLEDPLRRMNVDRIGSPRCVLRVAHADGAVLEEVPLPNCRFDGALIEVARCTQREALGEIVAVGHRVVHGGSQYSSPLPVTPVVVQRLRDLIPIDPQHLPQAIAAIETMAREFPGAVQVACFDTAFHRTMPPVAQLYGLPYALSEEGVLRYGFHGLSYESIVRQLRERNLLPRRLIAAHLGNGSSIAAILEGRSVDTTMGFTPTGGLVMGTRSGDLDPGVAVYLLESHGLDANGLSVLVNRESGLLGLSGLSSDVRDLISAASSNDRAALAIDVFCYAARKHTAAMAAVLDGIDAVVFTGGIGEHSAEIRSRICSGLSFLGIELDESRNAAGADRISSDGHVSVMVMQTDEDGMIARHTAQILDGKDGDHVHV
jgi:acetate kinase